MRLSLFQPALYRFECGCPVSDSLSSGERKLAEFAAVGDPDEHGSDRQGRPCVHRRRSAGPLVRGAFYGLCGAPLCQELRDERVLVIRVDSQGCQRERHRDSGVIAQRPRHDGARIRGMGVVDPDRVVNQPAEFRIAGSGFKMHQQSVPRRPSATGDGVEGSCRCRMRMRLTLCGGERLILCRGLTFHRPRRRGRERRLRRWRRRLLWQSSRHGPRAARRPPR